MNDGKQTYEDWARGLLSDREALVRCLEAMVNLQTNLQQMMLLHAPPTIEQAMLMDTEMLLDLLVMAYDVAEVLELAARERMPDVAAVLDGAADKWAAAQLHPEQEGAACAA